jgi:hypothetical protein
MADHIHLFKPGASVTFTASAAITGKRLVEVSGDRAVAPAAADSAKVVGAAAQDTKTGDEVLVLRGGVQSLISSAAILAGARVKSAALGKVITVGAGERGVGLALTTTTATDQPIQVALD